MSIDTIYRQAIALAATCQKIEIAKEAGFNVAARNLATEARTLRRELAKVN